MNDTTKRTHDDADTVIIPDPTPDTVVMPQASAPAMPATTVMPQASAPAAAMPAGEAPDVRDDEYRQRQAWTQQRQAAHGYADEAQRNGYPGSGVGAQAAYGGGYANYPGWSQYAPAAQPPTPRIEYKRTPSAATIVWGVILTLVAVGGLAFAWMIEYTVPSSAWTVLAILALVLVGATLVVGGLLSAVRRHRDAGGRQS